MDRLQAFGFLLVFAVPAQMPLAAWLATATGWPNASAWFPLFFLLVMLPAVDTLRGHHVHVVTEADASSARFGQSLWIFLPHAIWLNTRNAWALEAVRLRGLGLSPLSWQNEMLRWTSAWLRIAMAFRSCATIPIRRSCPVVIRRCSHWRFARPCGDA